MLLNAFGPNCTALQGMDHQWPCHLQNAYVLAGMACRQAEELRCRHAHASRGCVWCVSATSAPAVAAAVAAVLLRRCLGCCPPSQALPAHVWWDCPACMQHTTPARLFHVIGIQKVTCCFRRTVDEACHAYLRRVEDTCSTGCCCFWLVVSRCDVKA